MEDEGTEARRTTYHRIGLRYPCQMRKLSFEGFAIVRNRACDNAFTVATRGSCCFVTKDSVPLIAGEDVSKNIESQRGGRA